MGGLLSLTADPEVFFPETRRLLDAERAAFSLEVDHIYITESKSCI